MAKLQAKNEVLEKRTESYSDKNFHLIDKTEKMGNQLEVLRNEAREKDDKIAFLQSQLSKFRIPKLQYPPRSNTPAADAFYLNYKHHKH